MTGTVYLRTNRFEVKIEAITFKTKDFESLCKMDFLFPDGKVWASAPIVGLDVMRHPRDPSFLLVLLCFGVGCVILRFRVGEALPVSIYKFLADKRIHFVGFGIPEKKDLFPFEDLGLTKRKVDIGYLAAKILKIPNCKRWELAELARKVLGIKRMIGLTEASSFERHEQIKCAICQLFITSVIAMGLLGAKDKKISDNANNKIKFDDSPKKNSFLKNLNALHLLAEEWFKLPIIKKKNETNQTKKEEEEEEEQNSDVHIGKMEDMFGCNIFFKAKRIEGLFENCLAGAKIRDGDPEDYSSSSSASHDKIKEYSSSNKVDLDKEFVSHYDSNKEDKRPLKGILKCPSTGLLPRCNSSPSMPTPPPPPSPTVKHQTATGGQLKRANSKGCNVTFKYHQ